MSKDDFPTPTYDEMFNPLLQAIHELGGSGTIEEIEVKVAEIMGLSEEQLEILHDPDRGSRTKFGYRLAWARTYLKKYGVLENSSRGVWSLTTKGRKVKKVKTAEVIQVVRDQRKNNKKDSKDDLDTDEQDSNSWEDELLGVLLEMSPDSFERLTQHLLREAGFIQVEVTGRAGDGGIDGKGIMRLSGLLSFHVIFQCKRYQGSVGSSKVRDFRGAMVGRADKGLLITTGTFTKDAKIEANRDGAPPIELIDGEDLIKLLKDLSLGVITKIVEVEHVTINKEWLLSI